MLFTQVEQLRELILECSVHRAWNGESTVIRLATCPDLLNITRAITSTLVAHGGEVKEQRSLQQQRAPCGLAARAPCKRSVPSQAGEDELRRLGP